ncbi:MAG TPA: histidine phosphatase family protein [Synergistales bacterium]|nr:histidine phosphatase family protein [Synergistales bacterium]
MTGIDRHFPNYPVHFSGKPKGLPENGLAFVRHGEPGLPHPQRIFLGRIATGLSALGRAQAERVSLWARPFSWEGFFCSPLVRARETAEIIGMQLGMRPVVKEELAEIDLGRWDGRGKADIASECPLLWEQREKDLFSFPFPGGESFADLEARAAPFLLSLLLKGGRWLIVSHAGVFRVLLHGLFKVPFPETFRLDPGYGGIRLVEREGGILLVKDLEGLQVARGVLP